MDCCTVLFLSITKSKSAVYTCRGNSLKRKFTPLQACSCSYFIPLRRTFFCHWKPMAEFQPLHVFTTQQRFLWTSSSRCCQFFTFVSFHASAFMDHCVFAVHVEEKGRVAEGGLAEVQLPSSTTWVIFSHPACDPHTVL